MPTPIVNGRRPTPFLEVLLPLYLLALVCDFPRSSGAWLIGVTGRVRGQHGRPSSYSSTVNRIVGARAAAAAGEKRPTIPFPAERDSWQASPLLTSSSSDSTPASTDAGTAPTRRGGMLLMSLRHRLATTNRSLSSHDGESREGGKVRLVLASQSPRRREILAMMGLEGRFDVVPSPADEQAVQSQMKESGPIAPPEYAERLARAKALALAEHWRANPHGFDGGGDEDDNNNKNNKMSVTPTTSVVVVLGSDTIVELDGCILEKPRDESEAKEMLSRLSGREHLVHTGVALARVNIGTPSSDEISSTSFVDTAAVQFITLMPEDIDAYVSTGEPMDKAGSYGIQGMGGQMVQSITGDFFTVMGLPMCRVSQELARLIEELPP